MITITHLYCAAADLHPLVNNNTLTQQGVSTNFTANSALAQPTSKRADATVALT